MECQCEGCYPEREARRKHRETMDKINKTKEDIAKASNEPESEAQERKVELLNKLLKVYREALLK